MKPSEFYRQLFDLDARRDALVRWVENVVEFGRSVRVQADADGMIPEVVEGLSEYQHLLDAGPPDGSSLGGAAAPERRPGWPKGRKRGPRKVASVPERPDKPADAPLEAGPTEGP